MMEKLEVKEFDSVKLLNNIHCVCFKAGPQDRSCIKFGKMYI